MMIVMMMMPLDAPYTQVMPRDYEEIVLYLGGKRILDHFLDSGQEHAYD
jgi:hypothetical protein